ncbi:ArnT family glycosyltransferase [Candidatus Omnitrophota bacterium]
MNQESENKKSLTNPKIILVTIILFSLALRLPALFSQHIENDELIYQVLADKVSSNPGDYSLQGTAILNQLPKIIYDKPLFHYPPLFTYGLILFEKLFGDKYQILFPVLASVLTILIIFAIGSELYDEKVGLTAAFILSFCPITLHSSTKIWIDAVLTLFCALSVYLSVLAVKREKAFWYILAGISFGLAVLLKFSALLIIAPIAYLFLRKLNAKRLIYAAYFLIFSMLVTGPWLFIFYKTFGTFFPWWVSPSEELARMFPFIEMTMNRPWYFYFSNLGKVAPIYLFAWVTMARSIRRTHEWLVPIWALAYIGGFTLIRLMGMGGCIMRHILPAIPAFSILSARLAFTKNKILCVISSVFLAYGLMTGVLNAFFFQVADVFPFSYFLALIK